MEHAVFSNRPRLRWVKLAIMLAVGLVLVWNFNRASSAGGQTRVTSTAGARDENPEAFFARPYDPPKDVFDLPRFDRFRKGRRLDVAGAMNDLKLLSRTDLVAAQRLFDVTAWKAFVALNWPAKGDGSPDTAKGFADNGTLPVWWYWRQTKNVFLPDGGKPAPWGGSANSRGRSADSYKAGWRQETTADQGRQAFSGPLVDQNGRWVHYTAMMNRPEFDYIVRNELYNLEGQAVYTRGHTIEFPVGDDDTPGAVEIKLAWKVLTPEEIHSNRFLMVKDMEIEQYRPPSVLGLGDVPNAHVTGKSSDNGYKAVTKKETVGLIGMHIAMRTRSSPQWIWATFEHVDNTRLDESTGDSSHPLPGRPSLSNPDDPEALIGANLLPAYNAVGADGKPINDWDESKRLAPVEVLRLVPPQPGTEKLNRQMQAFLGAKGSVLRYYELIGTQWPKDPDAPAVPGGEGSAPESIVHKMPGDVVPVYLINSTMETYFQKGYQQAGPLEQDDRVPFSIDTTPVFGTESCVGCHYSAGACIGFRKNAAGKKTAIFGENSHGGLSGSGNFSWALQIEAKSKEQ